MSKKNNQQETPKQEARAMTKYDRKMQAYEEQEKKAKAHKNIGNVIGVVIVLAVAALVLSFPIRNYMAVNGTYINVGGEKVTKVEFDYHYAMARTGFIAQYSNYLSNPPRCGCPCGREYPPDKGSESAGPGGGLCL